MIEVDLNWAPTEPAELTQLLDEHHLVVVGPDRESGWRFAAQLGGRLATMPNASLVAIDGRRVDDVESLAGQLAASLGLRCARGDLDTVIELLRSSPGAPQYQYFLWRDAERLVARNADLFGHLANAMLAVAAEKEHVSADPLVIQRCVFVGGERLEACADAPESPLRTWRLENGATPFWEVISSVPHPPVLTLHL